MTSEIRVNKLENRVGLGTIEYSNTGPVISGVTTASNFKTGSSNLHSSGVEVAGINVLGADTPIGLGATIFNSGDVVSKAGAEFQGIVTATSFSGSGANLTSLPAQATIANNADNRVITGGSGVNLNGEANLTFDGNKLVVNNTSSNTAAEFKGAGGAGFIGIRDGDDSTIAFIGVDAGILKFQTSGSSYSDKVIIQPNGRVGVNTDNAQTTLYSMNEIAAGDGNRRFIGMETKVVDGTPVGEIRTTYYSGASGSYPQMRFVTNDTERIRIDNSGLVGIGTGLPLNRLHVKGSNTVARFQSTTSYVDIKLQNSNNQLGFIQYNGTELRFFANSGSTPTVYIPNGKFGVNRVPSTTLHIQDAAPEIRLTSSDANLGQSDIVGKLSFSTSDPTTPTGAGVVSLIEAYSATSNGSDYTTSINNRAGAGGGETMIRLGNALGQIRFYTHPTGTGTERLRITKDGDIYAGNESGYAIFDNSTIRPRFQFRQGTGTNRGFALIETRGDANSMALYIAKSREGNGTGVINSGDQLGSIQFTGSDGTNQVTGAQIMAYTSGTIAADRIPTNLSFYTSPDNTQGKLERLRISSDGKIDIGGSTRTGNAARLTVTHTNNSGVGLIDIDSYGSATLQIRSNWSGGTINGMPNESFGFGTPHAYPLVFTTSGAERIRITSTGKIGINYAGTPPSETFMIRPASDESVSRLTLSHLSGGNSYGSRISSIGGASKGFDLATQFNSSYITRARMTDRGVFQLSPSDSISSVGNSFVLNIVTNYSATYPVYSGIALKNLESGGGNGMCIHTTSSQWDLYTRAGNQSGLSIAHSNVASSSHSRMYVTEAGEFCVGTHVYDRLPTARKGHSVFHVAGGGLSVGPKGNTGTTKDGGRYVLGWYMVTHNTSSSYTHLITDLWAGGSPHGNSEYIMGGFHIHGHNYSGGSSVSRERIYFHNWSGSYPGYSNSNPGNWSPGNTVYTHSTGYVALRLLGGSYRGYIIDLVQHAWYGVRDINVTSVVQSNSTTL